LKVRVLSCKESGTHVHGFGGGTSHYADMTGHIGLMAEVIRDNDIILEIPIHASHGFSQYEAKGIGAGSALSRAIDKAVVQLVEEVASSHAKLRDHGSGSVSQSLAESKTAEKLRMLTSLRENGLIDANEYRSRRADVLGISMEKSVGLQKAVPRSTLDPTASLQHTLLWSPGERRGAWLLLVGIEDYRNGQVPVLKYAASDAARMKECFIRNQWVQEQHVRLLTNEQATRRNLLKHIDWLRKSAMPEDLAIIYFACHGAPELAEDGSSVDAKYLVLHDTDPKDLFATGLPFDELHRLLDKIKAKTQVIILESCYSGPVGKNVLGKTVTADLEIRPKVIQRMAENPGRVILSASSGRQVAIATDAVEKADADQPKEIINGALFTHYLLHALGDGTQPLVKGSFVQAREKTRRAANALGSWQEPQMFGDKNLDVILKSPSE